MKFYQNIIISLSTDDFIILNKQRNMKQLDTLYYNNLLLHLEICHILLLTKL